MPQGQDEFYFTLPYEHMDLALWGLNHGASAAELARAIGVTPAQAEQVYSDIRAKRRTTAYLHLPAQLVASVAEITGERP
jgi:NAD+ synthase